MTKPLFGILLILVAVLGVMLYRNGWINPMAPSIPAETQGGEVRSFPEVGVLTPAGEVDQQKFEASQQITKDDSVQTLQAELDKTVILDENFR
jgi:hypothetical protein